MISPRTWCEFHEDKRDFSHQSTRLGEIVNVYVDEWTPGCKYIEGTGKYIKDGYLPEKTEAAK